MELGQVFELISWLGLVLSCASTTPDAAASTKESVGSIFDRIAIPPKTAAVNNFLPLTVNHLDPSHCLKGKNKFSPVQREPWRPPGRESIIQRKKALKVRDNTAQRFYVSQSDLQDVEPYIANQEMHHAKVTFQGELRAIPRQASGKV